MLRSNKSKLKTGDSVTNFNSWFIRQGGMSFAENTAIKSQPLLWTFLKFMIKRVVESVSHFMVNFTTPYIYRHFYRLLFTSVELQKHR